VTLANQGEIAAMKINTVKLNNTLTHKQVRADWGFSSVGNDIKPQTTKPASSAASPFSKVLSETRSCFEPDRRRDGKVLSNQQFREKIMNDARSSPEAAYKLLNTYTFNSLTMPLYDDTDEDYRRYSGNGEMITAESEAYFGKIMQAAQRERNELYRFEMEKGTPPIDILEKILAFNDSLPPRFLDMCYW
jgi:hypothetical protein